MALNRRTIILGSRILSFVRDGTDDAGTPVSASHAPDTDPLSALYESIGDAETGTIESSEETLTIKTARSGSYKKRQTIPLSLDIALRFKMVDVTQLTFESLFRFSGAITIATGQIPLRQSAPITGWLWFVLSDQTRTNTLNCLLRVELRVNQYQVAEREYSHELMVTVLENDLNLVNLAALASMGF